MGLLPISSHMLRAKTACLFISGLFGLESLVKAQTIIEEQPNFGQTSSAMDPIDFSRLVPVENGYWSLAKAKGRHGGKSTYKVQGWSADLYEEWNHTLEFSKHAQPIGFHVAADGQNYGMLVHTWNLRENTSSVEFHTGGAEVGGNRSQTTLATYHVATWQNSPSKGQVAARMEGVSRSGIGHEPPLGYQVWARYSPSKNYFLLYHYEFGKPNLLVNVDLFTADGEKVASGQLPINRNRISYDLYLNDRGETFLLETTPNGGVGMVRYDLRTRESVFLEISSSNYLRTQFQVHMLSNDEVYVANEAERDGELEGVMFAHFNFAEHEVQDITFWKLSSSFKHRYDTTLRNSRNEDVDWKNIDLVDFRIDAQGRRFFTLEKREYLSPGFTYDHKANLHPDIWYGRNGSVQVGDAFVVAFDKKNEFLGSKVILKTTSAHSDTWIRTIGVEVHTADHFLYVVHHTEGLAGHQLVLTEWDPVKDIWKDISLNTSGPFFRIRDYTRFTKEGVIIAGFDALAGKSSSLIHFSKE